MLGNIHRHPYSSSPIHRKSAPEGVSHLKPTYPTAILEEYFNLPLILKYGVSSANRMGALDTIAEGQRIAPYYPPNRGFWGTPVTETLQKGTLIDRFGAGGGRFASPVGTAIPARALPPGVAEGPYNVFRVVKPFEVRTGQVSPWFGQPGMGVQHELPVSVTDLLRNGYIERVGP